MTDQIDKFFAQLAEIHTPVLTDFSQGTKRQIVGRDLTDWLDRTAGWLANSGVKPGSCFVARFDNTLESALILLAAMRHGMTVTIQHADASDSDIGPLAQSCGATVIVDATSRNIPENQAGFRAECLMEFEPLMPEPVPPRTPFTITFTSGSTGTPKGIVHAAESYLKCSKAFNAQAGIGADDTFLNVMPMYYMAGIFNGIIAPLQAGASVVIYPAFDTRIALTFWNIINDNAVSCLWVSPTMLSLITRLDRTEKRVPKSLRRIFVGTGALEKAHAEAFHATYGLPPLQSYGLSELLYISVDDAERPQFGTVGRPLAEVELSFDSSGILSIATPYAFLGYLQEGEIGHPDSLFRTSDLARTTDSGALTILGRSDDIILRGGVNVNPLDLESVMVEALAGRRYCVTGLPDVALGQKVVLALEGPPCEGDEALFATLQKLVRSRFGRVQLDMLNYVAAMPQGPTGKVRRAELHQVLAHS
ncbi:AMP-binding protein [Pelagibius litoralis]|uniref:AMP-binding protein n=1 Tax=Pelagibius litoralis TaxID=374515 RepID=A0A967EY70_9PROT|nr:long-chain fatty acid--CoA ligase [Pelagibius litoralis]NIA69549.1 AMP-binding protein [Pelagibius litoralis]